MGCVYLIIIVEQSDGIGRVLRKWQSFLVSLNNCLQL